MKLIKTTLIVSALAMLLSTMDIVTAHAQSAEGGTSISFGDREQNTDAPIDVTSAQLAIDENANTALFTGDVVVVQDNMTLYAPWVKVFYLEDQSGISHMHAKDGVTLIQGEEAAESETADYSLKDDVIIMSGDVLVTQKLSAIAADKMTIQLEDGTALMTGRVKSLLRTNSKKKGESE
ncbi:MAG: LptA/OstA family protein [Planktotalea sp.]|uniref:LptA/OstA family protein n=1 Tax=Planktotalea sp. TaxID=2029877 RepID=UPI003C75E3C6